VDNNGNGASGQTFGSLAGITAGGRNVKASVVDARTIQVTFTPNSDGTFRIIVAAPSWSGGNAMATVSHQRRRAGHRLETSGCEEKSLVGTRTLSAQKHPPTLCQ
jgi:hypothetical protein